MLAVGCYFPSDDTVEKVLAVVMSSTYAYVTRSCLHQIGVGEKGMETINVVQIT
jgi:hypothetical protein